MAKAIHAMIRVLDLERSIDFYQRALGLGVADHFDFDDFALVYLRNDENDFEIELTLNKNRSEPYRTWRRLRPHRGLRSPTARASVSVFNRLGFEPNDVKEFHRDGELMARFFFVQDPDGYKIEVLERHGRYQ